MSDQLQEYKNIFENSKEYLLDIEGRTLRNLDEEMYKNIVIFLDIDDTLGIPLVCLPRPIDISVDILNTFTKDSDKIKEIKRVSEDFYKIEYYSNINPTDWVLVEVMFSFKNFLRQLGEFFEEKKIQDVFLFSAAGSTYIECIRRILITDYHLNIKDVFYANKIAQRMYINIDNNTREVVYHAKDMWPALESYKYDNSKIPILFDDREYWGANGYVVKIQRLKNDISDFLDNPIHKTPGLLIVSFNNIPPVNNEIDIVVDDNGLYD